MRRWILAVALAVLASPAFAGQPLPEGARATLTVEIVARYASRNDIVQVTGSRRLEGRCTLSAGAPVRGNMMTGEPDMSGTEGLAARGAQMERQANTSGVRDMQREMERAMAACGRDTACQMAAAQRFMADPRMGAAQSIARSGEADARRAETAMRDTNYQELRSSECSARMFVEEQRVVTDITVPGGPETIVARGEQTVTGWETLLRGDFKRDQTALFLTVPEAVSLTATSSKRGRVPMKLDFLPPGLSWGIPIGPKPGFLNSGVERLSAQGAEMTVSWTFAASR